MGFSQLLMRADCSDKMKGDLEKIHKEAVRCQKIVQNLLTFARRHAPERSVVQINDVLAATLELRAYQLKVDNIEVVSEVDSTLPETLVDFHQIQQVFINIINNAHQAMLDAHGRGRLVLRTERAGDSIRVSFTDDGPGIPEEKVGKIFDPFFTTKEPGKGTGLGLSLSYGIIRDHEGRILTCAAPGGGAMFIVELPIRQPAAGTSLQAPAPTPRAPGVSRKRILIVDDEEVILELLGAILQAEGHEVDTARNGRVAIEKVKAGHFDLIISDLKMPDLGGQGLWESIRAIDPDLSRRMIFSTGDTVNPTTLAFFRKAGNPVLSKPFRIEEVDQTIRRALSGGQSIH
jgi:two-component system NtrC family sensor kinase